MNVLTPMPDGSLVALQPHEAETLRGYLLDRMAHVEEFEQAWLKREADRLKAVVDPSQAYAEWGIG